MTWDDAAVWRPLPDMSQHQRRWRIAGYLTAGTGLAGFFTLAVSEAAGAFLLGVSLGMWAVAESVARPHLEALNTELFERIALERSSPEGGAGPASPEQRPSSSSPEM